MAIVADTYTYVVGVDTHAATHHYAIIDTARGAQIAHGKFPTHAAGLVRAADWVARHTSTGADQVLVSMEGTGSYGAQAAALLAEHGYRVVDAPSPKRDRGSGKNDHIDAVTAARGALHKDSDRLADRRAGNIRSALQILLTARDSMRRDRTRSKNALTALLRTHPLGLDARTGVTRAQINQITAWRQRPTDTTTIGVARAEARRLASHIHNLNTELDNNERTLLTLVEQLQPTLLDLPGIGPINAATVLTVWSHPGRIHTEAGFAKIGGVCPLEISSGNTKNHRLNRTGDRQLNSALESIANSRMRHHETTRDYVKRRTKQGQTKRRIRRCLKRYIARQLFRHLTQATLDKT
ncbi:MAG: IS110 family transposase [Micropruina sp.]